MSSGKNPLLTHYFINLTTFRGVRFNTFTALFNLVLFNLKL